MLQEFYKTTVVTKFIKYLLANEAVPLNRIIMDNDVMYKGCLYSYKSDILLCAQTGRFVGEKGNLGVVDYLRVREDLEVSDTQTMNIYVKNPVTNEVSWNERPLTVTDNVVDVDLYVEAKYYVVSSFEPFIKQINKTEVFNSNCNYYDPATHKALGKYLRYLNCYYGLNLSHLYNCYCGECKTNLQYSKSTENVIELESKTKKMLLIPIHFDTEYTIAIDCDVPLYYRAVFYNNGVVKDYTGQDYLHDYINESLNKRNSSQFIQPWVYKVSLGNALIKNPQMVQNLHAYDRYLYMMIEVPASVDSSVVVLEGDYAMDADSTTIDVDGVFDMPSKELGRALTSSISLLEKNDGITRPFADKLVQFLLRNTIDPRETIDENIVSVQKSCGYLPEHLGQWDNKLRYILYNSYKNSNTEDIDFSDVTGYIDSNMEKALRKGYLNLDSTSI